MAIGQIRAYMRVCGARDGSPDALAKGFLKVTEASCEHVSKFTVTPSGWKPGGTRVACCYGQPEP